MDCRGQYPHEPFSNQLDKRSVIPGPSYYDLKEAEIWSKLFSTGFPIMDTLAFFSC